MQQADNMGQYTETLMLVEMPDTICVVEQHTFEHFKGQIKSQAKEGEKSRFIYLKI